jgi:hypothetical protein
VLARERRAGKLVEENSVSDGARKRAMFARPRANELVKEREEC